MLAIARDAGCRLALTLRTLLHNTDIGMYCNGFKYMAAAWVKVFLRSWLKMDTSRF